MPDVIKIEASIISRTKLKVAAYARVSTDSEQQLSSLEAQKKHYERYIKSNRMWTFAGMYFDSGISGTGIKKRTALKDLLKDCESGKINRIITKSISRFSRNTAECLEMVRRLSRMNVSIYFEKENIDTELINSELLLSILSSIAESESRSISKNIRWSVRRRFEAGTYRISTLPYGYRYNEEQIVIDESEGEVVRSIFRMSVSGIGTHTIANKLNSDGIPSRRAKRWHFNTVDNILKNPFYTGDAYFQKTYMDDSYRKKLNKGEKDLYLIKNHHDPIITKEIFDIASEERKRRALTRGIDSDHKYSNRYPLSSKIRCSICGSNFKRCSSIRNGEKIISWSCQDHIRDKFSCSNKAIKEDEILMISERMIEKLTQFNNRIIKPLLEKIQNKKSTDGQEKLEELGTRIKDYEKQIENLSRLFSTGILEPDVYIEEKTAINNMILELKKAYERIADEYDNTTGRIEEVRKLHKTLRKANLDFEAYIREFIDHIEVSGDCLTFYLKCGLELKEKRR